MDQKYDPRSVLTAVHHKATNELLGLMDGFYSNIEDGLFELAYRVTDQAQQRRCFDLMRELRFRRSKLVQAFARKMQKNQQDWFEQRSEEPGHEDELESLATRMALKCNSHFHPLLEAIAQRATYATSIEYDAARLPIAPLPIATAFLQSCHSLKFDRDSIEIVQELFARFVLDRMGAVYGDSNQQLEEAGFFTNDEIEQVSSA
jgi:hypothetical protein